MLVAPLLLEHEALLRFKAVALCTLDVWGTRGPHDVLEAGHLRACMLHLHVTPPNALPVAL